jgi:hypothetical protein
MAHHSLIYAQASVNSGVYNLRAAYYVSLSIRTEVCFEI